MVTAVTLKPTDLQPNIDSHFIVLEIRPASTVLN
jgi:hypothetical protein